MSHKTMAYAKETLTVAASPTPLTANAYGPNPSTALLTVEDAPIRWWATGDNPTTSQGHLAHAGAVITLTDPNEVIGFRAIRTGAASAVLQVTYGR